LCSFDHTLLPFPASDNDVNFSFLRRLNPDDTFQRIVEVSSADLDVGERPNWIPQLFLKDTRVDCKEIDIVG